MIFFIFHGASKSTPRDPHGAPKARAESAQGSSGTLLSTPGDALGGFEGSKAAYEPSKDPLKPV